MADDVLERRYRRLLFAYSAEFRTRNGDELVTTLMDCAKPGQRVPRPSEAIDLIASGLRQRLGLNMIPGFPEGLANAAPIALALATGLAAHVWWQLEPTGPHSGFRTLGLLAFAVWLLAGLAAALPSRRVARAAIGFALTVTIVVIPVLAALTTYDRPPLWVLMALAGFGAIAFGGTGVAAGAPTCLPVDIRLAVPAGAVAFAATAWAITQAFPPNAGDYYEPLITRVGMVATATVLTVAAIATVRLLLRRTDGNWWLWTAALLGVPTGWLGPFDTFGDMTAAGAFPHFGRLAQVLFATCIAAATLWWLARSRVTAKRSGSPRTLAQAGAITIGCAAGLSFGIPVIVGATPWPVTATSIVLVVAGLAAWTPSRAVHHWAALLGSAVVTVPVTWLVAVYANDWSTRDWNDPAYTATLVATVAFVPLTIGALAAVRVLRHHPTSTHEPRWAPILVVVVSVGWLSLWTLPHLPSWGPAMLALASCVAAPWLSRRRHTPR
ncbi:hypothetical protein [Stackebrandtia nassauensis]|nr:hypothetical protein [Stackebrandtia nassauensis]